MKLLRDVKVEDPNAVFIERSPTTSPTTSIPAAPSTPDRKTAIPSQTTRSLPTIPPLPRQTD